MQRSAAILLFGWALLASTGICGELPDIVAHRGASHDAPENTLAAFRLAWEQGADAIEGDFFLTKDREIVCTHDKTTERLCGKRQNLVVADSTLEELLALDVGSWKNDEWKGERMPTLSEVLKTVPAARKIFIEVKCGAEIVPELKKVITGSSLQSEQIVIISFQEAVVREAKLAMPQVKTYWLAAFNKDKKTGKIKPTMAEVKRTLKRIQADGFSCGDHESISRELLDAVRADGCETHCWTIDDPARAKELVALGMKSITTNRPALIRKALLKQ